MEKKRAPLRKKKQNETFQDDHQKLIDKNKKLQQIQKYADILVAHNKQYQNLISIYQHQISSLNLKLQSRQNYEVYSQRSNIVSTSQHQQQIGILLEKVTQLQNILQQNISAKENIKIQWQNDIQMFKKEIYEKNEEISILLLQNTQLKQKIQQNITIIQNRIDPGQVELLKQQLSQIYQENRQLKRKIHDFQYQKKQEKTYSTNQTAIELQIFKEKLASNQRRMEAYQEEIAMLSSTIKKYQLQQIQLRTKHQEQLAKKNKILIDRDNQLQQLCKNLAYLDKNNSHRNHYKNSENEENQQKMLKKTIDQLVLKNEALEKQMLMLQKQTLAVAQMKLQKELSHKKNQSELQSIIISLQAIVKQDQAQMKQLLIDFSNEKVRLMVSNHQENMKMKDYYEEKLRDTQEISQRKIRILEKQLEFYRQN